MYFHRIGLKAVNSFSWLHSTHQKITIVWPIESHISIEWRINIAEKRASNERWHGLPHARDNVRSNEY